MGAVTAWDSFTTKEQRNEGSWHSKANLRAGECAFRVQVEVRSSPTQIHADAIARCLLTSGDLMSKNKYGKISP
jgi:hypothetical protein